ncbi:hypothetical protein D7M10_19905 [Pseudomonas fluorescens]|nr:hypothetical protein D7M10_19905 [Pseudomonas fluorescens]
MQMHEAGEVVQVAGAASANKLLQDGWKLLAVTAAGNGSESGKTFVWYVLGKPLEMGSSYFDSPT